MSDYKFSADERFAIFTIHGEKCYLCGKPIALSDMVVDHVIPEALLKDKEKLAKALTSLGRPEDFNVNSYANWLPACHRCNTVKSDMIFDPSPIVQIHLQNATQKAEKAEEMENDTVSKRKVSSALSTLKRAYDDGKLDRGMIDSILSFLTIDDVQQIIRAANTYREPELVGEPLRLTPLFTVLSESDGVLMIKGPYGVGGGSTSPDAPTCPVCGHSAWNGTRCVICGDMNED